MRSMRKKTRILSIVVCAAGPAADVGILVRTAQDRGWTVQLIATPAAAGFLDVQALEKQTGRSVRSAHRAPGQPRSAKADAIIVAPASFNTVNKLAGGIADNYALDVLNEATGLGIPVAILPFVNSAYAKRLPFRQSVKTLEEEGVPVLIGPGAFEPHSPGAGGIRNRTFPWGQALEAVEGKML